MNISTFQSNLNFIKSLYFHEEWKDKKCRDTILEALEECNQKIEKAFGDSLHRLGWKHKPSVEAVEKVVQKFPSTLSYDYGSGRTPIPIQFAAAGRGFEYVPVLAKEGFKIKLGGENARGGLLMIDPHEYGYNTLQWLVEATDDDDEKRVKVLKELRKSRLLVKKDVQEQQLLDLSCWEGKNMIFEYLVSWDPDALIETRIKNEPLIHHMSSRPAFYKYESMMMVLKAGFKNHPNKGGLLFIKDNNGNIAFDCLCKKRGVEKAMLLLHDILSTKRDYPILHHVFINTPQHKDIFMKKFPWAYHLKDHNGRTLHQAVLAAGADVMNKNDMILASLSDNQIQTKDPITSLYPFAAMAVGEHADLEQCYYLLGRQPSVMDTRSRAGKTHRRKKRTRRKKRRKLSK